jgi:hypothetical protein
MCAQAKPCRIFLCPTNFYEARGQSDQLKSELLRPGDAVATSPDSLPASAHNHSRLKENSRKSRREAPTSER